MITLKTKEEELSTSQEIQVNVLLMLNEMKSKVDNVLSKNKQLRDKYKNKYASR